MALFFVHCRLPPGARASMHQGLETPHVGSSPAAVPSFAIREKTSGQTRSKDHSQIRCWLAQGPDHPSGTATKGSWSSGQKHRGLKRHGRHRRLVWCQCRWSYASGGGTEGGREPAKSDLQLGYRYVSVYPIARAQRMMVGSNDCFS